MKKLPSERIDEIYVSMKKELEGVRLDHAIIEYLDEEYERNKPCEHCGKVLVECLCH